MWTHKQNGHKISSQPRERSRKKINKLSKSPVLYFWNAFRILQFIKKNIMNRANSEIVIKYQYQCLTFWKRSGKSLTLSCLCDHATSSALLVILFQCYVVLQHLHDAVMCRDWPCTTMRKWILLIKGKHSCRVGFEFTLKPQDMFT